MVWNTVSNIIGKAIVFINVFIILNYLSVYQYGVSELVFSVVTVMSLAFFPGLTSAVTSDLGVERSRNNLGVVKNIFVQHSLFVGVVGVLLWAILFFLSPLVSWLVGNDSIGYFLKIASFLFLTSPIRTATLMLTSVEMQLIKQSVFSIIEETSKLLLILFLVVFLDLRIDGILYAAVFSQVFAIAVFFPVTVKNYSIFSHTATEQDRRFWGLLQGHRKWSVFGSYVGSLVQVIQIWSIRLILGTEAVGLFAFASGVYSHATSFMVFSSVLTSVFPYYVSKTEKFIQLVRAAIKAQGVLSLFVMVLSMALIPVLVLIFPKYKEAEMLTIGLLLGLIPNAVSMVLTPIFSTLKLQFQLFKSTLIKVVLSFFIIPVSLYFYGAMGIATSFVLVTTFSCFERYFRLKNSLPGFLFSGLDFFKIDNTERQQMGILYRAAIRRIAKL